MQEFLFYLKLYFLRLKLSLKILGNSLSNFIIGFSGFFVIQLTGLLFLKLTFLKAPQIEDFNYYEIITLYGFAQIPRGLDHFYSDFFWIFSSKTIIRGEFDKYLIRPVSPIFQLIIERVQFDALGEILIGIYLYIYGLSNLQLELSILSISILSIYFIIMGSIIYTCIKIICSSLAFWIKNSKTILQSVYSLSDFVKYPISIYPFFLEMILTFVVVFSLTSYFPIKAIIMDSNKVVIMVLSLMAVVLLLYITKIIWKKGVENYESSGT